jgi:hypothetical protein
LIKETVDAVRVAELEAENMVSSARDNAEGKKEALRQTEQEYKAKRMAVAKSKADKAMEELIDRCSEFEKKSNQDIEEKVAALQNNARGRYDSAVEAIIEALI